MQLGAVARERGTSLACRHPRDERLVHPLGSYCTACDQVLQLENMSRGRRARSRGNGHELKAARTYGGEKTGPLGKIEDIRGAEWSTQVKTRQGTAPAQWRNIFAAFDAVDLQGRTPRILLRFLPGPGIPADDYFVIRGKDALDRWGRDE